MKMHKDKQLTEEFGNSFPQTPDFIRQMVLNETDRQEKELSVHEVSSHRKRRWISGKAAAAIVFAIVLAVGTPVAAYIHYHLAETAEKNFSTSQAQDTIKTNLDVKVMDTPRIPEGYKEENREDEWEALPEIKDKSAVLEIKEISYDGSLLSVYAEPTSNGKNYDLDVSKFYIDGTQASCGATEIYNNQENEKDGLVIQCDLSADNLPDTFDVVMPVSIYKDSQRYKNQDLSFTVSNSTSSTQKLSAENQKFDLGDCTLEIKKITWTPASIHIDFDIIMTEEQKKIWDENGWYYSEIRLSNNDGTQAVITDNYINASDTGLTLTGSVACGSLALQSNQIQVTLTRLTKETHEEFSYDPVAITLK